MPSLRGMVGCERFRRQLVRSDCQIRAYAPTLAHTGTTHHTHTHDTHTHTHTLTHTSHTHVTHTHTHTHTHTITAKKLIPYDSHTCFLSRAGKRTTPFSMARPGRTGTRGSTSGGWLSRWGKCRRPTRRPLRSCSPPTRTPSLPSRTGRTARARSPSDGIGNLNRTLFVLAPKNTKKKRRKKRETRLTTSQNTARRTLWGIKIPAWLGWPFAEVWLWTDANPFCRSLVAFGAQISRLFCGFFLYPDSGCGAQTFASAIVPRSSLASFSSSPGGLDWR